MRFSGIRHCLMACTVAGVLTFAVAVSASDIADMVSNVCSDCHSTDRICELIGVIDEAAWKETVLDMIDEGASIPEARVDETASYLNGLKRGATPLCK